MAFEIETNGKYLDDNLDPLLCALFEIESEIFYFNGIFGAR